MPFSRKYPHDWAVIVRRMRHGESSTGLATTRLSMNARCHKIDARPRLNGDDLTARSRSLPSPVSRQNAAGNHRLEEAVGFRISGLRRRQFQHLFALDDSALAVRGAKRYTADKKPGFPCRVSLRDAQIGERVILTPFTHQPSSSPYQASGPVFVREAAEEVALAPNTVPELLRTRLLSVRAYDASDLMTAADVVEGQQLDEALARAFHDARVRYVHVHFARPGCFACTVDRDDRNHEDR
jgi:hypothetical protein